MKRFLPVALLLLVPTLLIAAVPVITDGNRLVELLQLITQWGVMAPLAKAMLAIMILVQAAKKLVPNFRIPPASHSLGRINLWSSKFCI